MSSIKIPTSKDIRIEINGKRVAIIESYKVTSTRKLYDIEEFSSPTPVATILASEKHQLELKTVYFIGQGKLDFHSLSNFSVVIVKPDCRITYSNCEWANIAEIPNVNSPCIETMTVISQKRSVL